MVSNASDDLPDPETPVMTTNLLRGTTTSMFLRLCSRAPRMMMDSMVVVAGLQSYWVAEAGRPSNSATM